MRGRSSETFTVMFPRQTGKNEISAVLIAALLREHAENGGSLVVCAPTFHPQAGISFERARHILGGSDLLLPNDGRSNAAVPTIAVGKARAVFLSASPEAHVAGHTASIGLIADEAQDIDADWFNRQFRPMAASTGAPTVMFGTPWNGETLLEKAVAKNRFHDRHARGLPYRNFLPRHHEVNWRTVARSLPAYGRHVRAERERLGAGHPLFRTQYELESAEGSGRLFSPAQIAALEGIHARLRAPIEGERYVAGLDLAGEGANADTVVLTLGARVDAGRRRPWLRSRRTRRMAFAAVWRGGCRLRGGGADVALRGTVCRCDGHGCANRGATLGRARHESAAGGVHGGRKIGDGV